MKYIAHQVPLIEGAAVCELGSYNVNGSVRELISVLKPREYLGVDVRKGPGVDVVADVTHGGLSNRYGEFDIVVSTEVIEHVGRWREFLIAAKSLCRINGALLVTGRGPGFPLHCKPDRWRYTTEWMSRAMWDMKVVDLRPDPQAPGVFVHAVRSGDIGPLNVETPERATA